MTLPIHRRLLAGWLLLLPTLWSAPLPALAQSAAELARPLISAWREQRPLPLLSREHPGLSTEQAYAVQRAFVNTLYSAPPAGFKAGLTTPASQEAFGVEAPVAGILPPDAALSPNEEGRYQIERGRFLRPHLELELGFILRRPVSAPVADTAALRGLVAQVLPVVEFPDLGFARRKGLRGTDVIAANVAARHYLAGPPLDSLLDLTASPSQEALNTLPVRLQRQGETLLEETAGSVLEGQWQALLWLINHAVAQGWTIEPGQVLLTGAIGPMLAFQPGCYRAHWGEATLAFCSTDATSP